MVHESRESGEMTARWRTRMDLTAILAVSALAMSGLSFYRSYIYTNQQLDVTVTEVSYVTNLGEVYMTVAFSNGGNRDAAVLRIEPALWHSDRKSPPAWMALLDKVHPSIPVTVPKTPLIVKAGGVEVITLSSTLNVALAERSAIASTGGAYLGI